MTTCRTSPGRLEVAQFEGSRFSRYFLLAADILKMSLDER